MDPTYKPPHGLPLIVAQYAIAGHTRRTEHWAFIVLRSRRKGDIHELRGNSDSFTYVTERDTPFAIADALRGGCHVGYVPKEPEGQSMFRSVLEHEVRVVRADAHWDCQNWIVEGLRALKEAGIVFRGMCEAKVRKELLEEMERWESADDAVYERLFPE
ncbi:hypothetical protein OF83DRAFT_1173437 [Amylostereum chailletii]|nr:hypothetical protein OF83DRAFT_1173437 [Amylostereum chailletii]